MNKPNKSSSNIFVKFAHLILLILKKIYKVIDKIIVTPIAKLIIIISRPFNKNTRQFDRMLNNKAFLLSLSMILALLAFFFINSVSDSMNNSAEVLSNQQVTALYNDEAFVVEGLPESVDVTMVGKRSDLYLAKQYPSTGVVVDLRDLKAGTHKVNLKYTGTISSVNYKLDPSTATIVIYEKVSKSKNITTEILNQDKLDSKYNISNIDLSRDDVYVKGAQYKVDAVATVKALVNAEDIVNPIVGTNILKEVPLVAYDKDGNKLDVEIVPSTIDATIEITSPSKEVPLKIETNGDLVFGKAIQSMTLSTDKITIYGDDATLSSISSVPVKVDVSNLTSSTEINIDLDKPTGITSMSISTVKVKITMATTSEKTIDGINIETRNLGSGLNAQAASQADTNVSVVVKGTSTNIDSITKDNITAYVDLTGLTAGTHVVDVKVEGDDVKLSYTPKTTTVTIIIK